MERFAAFPFSVGCISDSAVDVVDGRLKRAPEAQSTSAAPTRNLQPNGRTSKNAFTLPKPNIAAGIHKVVKGFKNLSYMFHFYNEDDEDDEEEERDMVIGFPTDVQHVGHIGWEGFNSGISLRQLELAMSNSQPHGPIA